MVTDAPSDEHPNVRRARFEAVVRDELVDPLRRYVAGRTGPEAVDPVLAETLLRCWHRFDEAPDPPLPWAQGIAEEVLAGTGAERRVAADPGELPEADPEWVTRLLAGVVGEHSDTESRRTGTRDRSRLTWLVAAVAVVLIGTAAAYAVLREPDPGTPEGDAGTPEVVSVTMPGSAGAQRCAMPTADALGRADLALDAEVSALSGSTATLTPTRVYRGGPVDEVRVAQATPSRESLILGVRFREGERYLVAVDDGRVMACGFSAGYDERLAALYDQAFPE